MRFVLELLRDFSGLIGAGLSAAAFFRLEGRKTEAASVNPEAANDKALQEEMREARATLVEHRVLAPNPLDLRLTVLGLLLIAVSFLISIALTVTEPSATGSEHQAPSAEKSTPAIPTGH